MKFICLLVLLVASLAGCASTQKFEHRLRSWEGDTASNLMSSWGAPAATNKAPNGATLYTYRFENGARAVATTDPITGITSSSASSYWCEVTFTTFPNSEIIDRWSWKGNNCVAD